MLRIEHKTIGTDFNWRRLASSPTKETTFIEGIDAQEFLEEYNGRVKMDYKNNPNLRIFSHAGGRVNGLTPFAAALIGDILRPYNIWIATPADLAEVLKSRALDLKESSQDSALVLRSPSDTNPENDYIAKDLARQIRSHNLQLGKLIVPTVIPLRGLGIREDERSGYGLSFDLREDAEIYGARILRGSGGFNSNDLESHTGLPSKLGEGNMMLFAGESGISRLSLERGRFIIADNKYLGYSNPNGNSVLMRE